ALLFYDYILTFNSEVALFWMGGRLSGATVLFLLSRYITLTTKIMEGLPVSSSVETYVLVSQYYDELRHVLRRDITVEVVTRSCLIASDLAVLCVTWFRTYQTAKLSLRSLGKKTFASILLLDGTIYFLALLILSVLHMAFTLNGVAKADATLLTSVIVILEETLTAILTSRFLMDLQKAQRKLAGSSRSVSLGEVIFQPQTSRNTSRFIGSLGAQLSIHEDGGEENEVEDMS
ncbi:hypothetical protein BD310DRAFT_810603, partial [Dichomitus squalens]